MSGAWIKNDTGDVYLYPKEDCDVEITVVPVAYWHYRILVDVGGYLEKQEWHDTLSEVKLGVEKLAKEIVAGKR
jgi:hypothetical protein